MTPEQLLTQLVDDALACAAEPANTAGHDGPSRVLASFLGKEGSSAAAKRVQWLLMRRGLGEYVNERRYQLRSEIKAQSEIDTSREDSRKRKAAREAARRAAANIAANQRRQAVIDYAVANGLPYEKYEDFKKTRDAYDEAMWKARQEQAAENMSNVYKAVEREASARALRLLNGWMCGDKMLGDCTGLDLDREILASKRQVEGHVKNVWFYEALRTWTPDNDTVRASAPATALLEAASSAFGTPNGSGPLSVLLGSQAA